MFWKTICVGRVHVDLKFHKLVQNFANVLLKQIQNLQNFVKIAQNDNRFCCERSADCCKMTKEIPYEFDYFVKSVHFFLKIWKKNQQKFWKRCATMMFFFAFGSPTLCQLLTKFHKIFQKRDHFFPKSCKVATHLAADTAAFAAQKQWKLLMNPCISKSFAMFFVNLEKN